MINEAELREAAECANIPTLLMVLVQLTGDLTWLEAPFLPKPVIGKNDVNSGGLSEKIQQQVRVAFVKAILEWHKGAPVAIPKPPRELLQQMLSVGLGMGVQTDYVSWAESLLVGKFPEVEKVPIPVGYRVLIVGAGVSGLCAAAYLQNVGIDFVLVDKNPQIGGTWFENRYPGCGVDTPNHHYSFSFLDTDWTRFFCHGGELKAYLERVADDLGLRKYIRFETEATENVYDESLQQWVTTLRLRDGSREIFRSNIVIAAVGLFNPPKIPSIKGLETFDGPAVHTASWPQKGIDLSGKRVAVIGNGASAMQLVPAIADTASSVTIFQRTPQWAAPVSESLRGEVPLQLRKLMQEIPLYRRWYRVRLAYLFDDLTYPLVEIDPDWPHKERSLNAGNEAMRVMLTNYIHAQIGDRTDLLEKVVPTYPPYGKRMLLDHGWFDALRKKNVHLVTERIKAIHEKGVITESGLDTPVDVIAFATGFDVTYFLSSLNVRGRGGHVLGDLWEDNGQAFMGCLVPGFPNFICLYGPNTQPGHGGSLIAAIESQMTYVQSLLKQTLEAGVGAFEVRTEALKTQYDIYDAKQLKLAWTHGGVSTYHRNARGRVVVSNPSTIIDYWKRTRRADLTDFVLEMPLSAVEGNSAMIAVSS